jgi:2-keto-4-pentenoate hydratase/2-oxohepta-3-ene-1,7-dioic acid hydratase in catechol pathway
MKLASFATPLGASYGIVANDCVIDLGLRFGPTAPDLKTFLAIGDLARAEDIAGHSLHDYRLDEITFMPTIPNPPRIFCVGLNYQAHREEGIHRDAAIKDPTIFLRVPESQVGHRQPMLKPLESEMFDYEGEIAVVIGRAGRRIPAAGAHRHIAGYACYNEGSVRDYQRGSSQFTAGKNFARTGAFGPWLVTADEIAPTRTLTVTTRLNGEEMQRGNSDQLIFPVETLIAFLSTFTALLPGDVIVTGTPDGVGLYRDPPVFLKPGDTVEVEVDAIGVLSNPVAEG